MNAAKRDDSPASALPVTTARRNPNVMCESVKNTDFQNRAVLVICASLTTTLTGETSKISLSSPMLANCHTSSQNQYRPEPQSVLLCSLFS